MLCHVPARHTAHLAQEISRTLKPGGWLYVAAFSYDDPRESEFAALVETYFTVETLRDVFPDLRCERYDEVRVVDTHHGQRHRHVLVRLIAQKEEAC